MSDLIARIDTKAPELPRAERQVAEVILADPAAAAFATVADVGRRAGVSGATVVRLAERLGYGGWVALQQEARVDLGDRLRPATERIRETVTGDVLQQTALREADNVHRTLAAVDRPSFDLAIRALADPRRTIHVLAGDAESGIGTSLVDALDLLRAGIVRVDGSPTAVARALAHARADDVVVAMDLRRYERWVLESVHRAADAGLLVIAITDTVLSPLSQPGALTFVVTAEGTGPFDSHVGTLALLNALTTGVARRLRRSAVNRLDRVEQAWAGAGALVDS